MSRKKRPAPVIRVKKQRYPQAVMAQLQRQAQEEDHRRGVMAEMERMARHHLSEMRGEELER